MISPGNGQTVHDSTPFFEGFGPVLGHVTVRICGEGTLPRTVTLLDAGSADDTVMKKHLDQHKKGGRQSATGPAVSPLEFAPALPAEATRDPPPGWDPSRRSWLGDVPVSGVTCRG